MCNIYVYTYYIHKYRVIMYYNAYTIAINNFWDILEPKETPADQSLWQKQSDRENLRVLLFNYMPPSLTEKITIINKQTGLGGAKTIIRILRQRDNFCHRCIAVFKQSYLYYTSTGWITVNDLNYIILIVKMLQTISIVKKYEYF